MLYYYFVSGLLVLIGLIPLSNFKSSFTPNSILSRDNAKATGSLFLDVDRWFFEESNGIGDGFQFGF